MIRSRTIKDLSFGKMLSLTTTKESGTTRIKSPPRQRNSDGQRLDFLQSIHPPTNFPSPPNSATEALNAALWVDKDLFDLQSSFPESLQNEQPLTPAFPLPSPSMPCMPNLATMALEKALEQQAADEEERNNETNPLKRTRPDEFSFPFLESLEVEDDLTKDFQSLVSTAPNSKSKEEVENEHPRPLKRIRRMFKTQNCSHLDLLASTSEDSKRPVAALCA